MSHPFTFLLQHPAPDVGSNQFRPQPPTSFNTSDGIPQPKRYGAGQPAQQNVWDPSAAGYQQPAPIESPQRGGGYGGFDQPQQQQSTTPTYQPVSFQKTAMPSGGYNAQGGGSNQFSTADSYRQEAPKASGPPSWRGAQQPQQASHVPVQHEYSNQAHNNASQRVIYAQTISI